MNTDNRITAISDDLGKQFRLSKDAITEINHTLALLENDAEAYNEAIENLAAVLVIDHFLTKLKGYVDSGDINTLGNFILFTCQKIEDATGKEVLSSEKPADSKITDAKVTVYEIFRSYAKIIDEA